MEHCLYTEPKWLQSLKARLCLQWGLPLQDRGGAVTMVFLNKICTHMVDIDYGKASLWVGNYDFWQQSSLLARELKQNENKKKEDKS